MRRLFRNPLARRRNSASSRRGRASQVIAQADAARDNGEWAEAAGHYRAAVELLPQRNDLKVQLGNMLKECGALGEAEAAYRTAIEREPQAADPHLQLGHALKLQGRPAEAAEAYLAAAARAPGMQQPLDELRTLGFSQRAVDAHIRAAATGKAGGTQPVEARGISVERITRPVVRGTILDVGAGHVTAEVGPLALDDLPFSIVCRADGAVVATRVIRTDAAAGDPAAIVPADLPGTVRFRIALDSGSPAIHALTFEPDGAAFSGSPFVLPGSGGAALLGRIAELERQLDSAGRGADLAANLRATLLPELSAMAAERIELALRDQRALFERQLVRTFSTVDGTPSPARDRPRRLVFEADDGFPGIGWSAARLSADGRSRRDPAPRGHVAAALAPGSGYLVIAELAGRLPEAALRQIALRSEGAHVPQVLLPHGDESGHHALIAILPSSAAGRDGVVRCAFDGAATAPPVGILRITVETLDRPQDGSTARVGRLAHLSGGQDASATRAYFAFAPWSDGSGPAELRVRAASIEAVTINGKDQVLPRPGASAVPIDTGCLERDRPNLAMIRIAPGSLNASAEPVAELVAVRT